MSDRAKVQTATESGAARPWVTRTVVGIVNGTTNYILTRMAETGSGFAEALAEATDLGYAEADPTADVDGFDAAAKAAILASLAFHTPVTAADVYREGISDVTASDVARAAEIGCTPAQAALAWLLHQGPDILPIPGTKRVRYLEENVEATEVTLSPAQAERLRDAVPFRAVAGGRYPDQALARLGH